MLVKEVQAYSKEKAYELSGVEVPLKKLKNATSMWKRSGSPINTKDLNKFMQDYMDKFKLAGAYLVIDPAVDDTRLRPYTVVNEVTSGRRKEVRVYEVKEAEFSLKQHKEEVVSVDEEGNEVVTEKLTPYLKETVYSEDPETGETVAKEIKKADVKVHSTGLVEAKHTKKDVAIKLMKELIAENRKDYVIEVGRDVIEGQKYAAYGKYTPSASAKEGKFIFFVSE